MVVNQSTIQKTGFGVFLISNFGKGELLVDSKVIVFIVTIQEAEHKYQLRSRTWISL